MKTLLATMAALAALFGGVFGGVQVMDERYVQTTDLQSLSIEIFYREYYDAEDKMQKAKEAHQHERVNDLRRRMERLKAKICALDPAWERCG